MKNPPFLYHRPDTLDSALAILGDLGDEAKVLAGGQSLLPIMALRLGMPANLVDIGRIEELDRIDLHDDGSVTIGALVRHATAERSSAIAEHAPLVHRAMPLVGHRAIRTRGTLCGSIAHADPAGELPAVALATDAVMVAQSVRGAREILARDFFSGYLDTALADDEILTAVRFPAWPRNNATVTGAIVEVGRRHGDYALVGAVNKLLLDGDLITDAALAYFGVSDTAVRVHDAEAALVGERLSTEVFATAAAIVSDQLTPSADIHASANYRKHLAGVLTRRGLAESVAFTGVAA